MEKMSSPTRSIENMSSRLEQSLRIHYEEFLFMKESIVNTGWTKGRPFNVRMETLFMTPTNLPTLSYLDLEEYSFDSEDHLPNVPHSFELFVEPYLEDICLESFYTPKHLSQVFQDLTETYMDRVAMSLWTEFEFFTGLTLMKKWDIGRFRRYMGYQHDRRYSTAVYDFGLKVYPRMLSEYCTSSEIIVDYFSRICTPSTSREFIAKVMPQYLEFFLKHFMVMGPKFQDCDKFRVLQKWEDLKLVEYAFIKGNVNNLKVLFQYHWPSCFVSYKQPESAKLWPQKRTIENSERDEIFNSWEFIERLVTFLVVFSWKTLAPIETVTSCISLLWKTLPTAHISMETVETWVNRLVVPPDLIDDAIEQEEIRAFFITVLPEDITVGCEPRSLLHLSRCAVRHTGVLPNGISELMLPTQLKSYLLLE